MVTNPTNSIGNRPFNRLDSGERPIYDSVDDLAFQGAYSGTNLVYKGFARAGGITSEPVWQIAFLTYDGSGNLTSVTWPQNFQGNASNDYEFVWTLRTTYTYV
jgi:YD repeat-containing protein